MIYQENDVMMIRELVGKAIVKRFYSAINHIEYIVDVDLINILVVMYDGVYNIDYVGEVEMYVNNEYVSRETIVNGLVTFDMSLSEVGEYEIVFKTEGLNDCVVTYEKN